MKSALLFWTGKIKNFRMQYAFVARAARFAAVMTLFCAGTDILCMKPAAKSVEIPKETQERFERLFEKTQESKAREAALRDIFLNREREREREHFQEWMRSQEISRQREIFESFQKPTQPAQFKNYAVVAEGILGSLDVKSLSRLSSSAESSSFISKMGDMVKVLETIKTDRSTGEPERAAASKTLTTLRETIRDLLRGETIEGVAGKSVKRQLDELGRKNLFELINISLETGEKIPSEELAQYAKRIGAFLMEDAHRKEFLTQDEIKIINSIEKQILDIQESQKSSGNRELKNALKNLSNGILNYKLLNATSLQAESYGKELVDNLKKITIDAKTPEELSARARLVADMLPDVSKRLTANEINVAQERIGISATAIRNLLEIRESLQEDALSREGISKSDPIIPKIKAKLAALDAVLFDNSPDPAKRGVINQFIDLFESARKAGNQTTQTKMSDSLIRAAKNIFTLSHLGSMEPERRIELLDLWEKGTTEAVKGSTEGGKKDFLDVRDTIFESIKALKPEAIKTLAPSSRLRLLSAWDTANQANQVAEKIKILKTFSYEDLQKLSAEERSKLLEKAYNLFTANIGDLSKKEGLADIHGPSDFQNATFEKWIGQSKEKQNEYGFKLELINAIEKVRAVKENSQLLTYEIFYLSGVIDDIERAKKIEPTQFERFAKTAQEYLNYEINKARELLSKEATKELEQSRLLILSTTALNKIFNAARELLLVPGKKGEAGKVLVDAMQEINKKISAEKTPKIKEALIDLQKQLVQVIAGEPAVGEIPVSGKEAPMKFDPKYISALDLAQRGEFFNLITPEVFTQLPPAGQETALKTLPENQRAAFFDRFTENFLNSLSDEARENFSKMLLDFLKVPLTLSSPARDDIRSYMQILRIAGDLLVNVPLPFTIKLFTHTLDTINTKIEVPFYRTIFLEDYAKTVFTPSLFSKIMAKLFETVQEHPVEWSPSRPIKKAPLEPISESVKNDVNSLGRFLITLNSSKSFEHSTQVIESIKTEIMRGFNKTDMLKNLDATNLSEVINSQIDLFTKNSKSTLKPADRKKMVESLTTAISGLTLQDVEDEARQKILSQALTKIKTELTREDLSADDISALNNLKTKINTLVLKPMTPFTEEAAVAVRAGETSEAGELERALGAYNRALEQLDRETKERAQEKPATGGAYTPAQSAYNRALEGLGKAIENVPEKEARGDAYTAAQKAYNEALERLQRGKEEEPAVQGLYTPAESAEHRKSE